MKQIIFATGNEGKLREVKNLFTDSGVEILSIADFENVPEIIEDADSFSGNAFIKADVLYDFTGMPVIADDSGLAVDQLKGAPGIYSARYAGENCTYEDNNRKLIKELASFKQPHYAKFICCAVYVDSENRIECTGELPGEIIKEFRGENGFGYDPIFVPKEKNKTLAEVSLLDKNKSSHRAKAFDGLKTKLIEKELL